MEFFVKAGITPLEVIRLATREAAIAVVAEDLGTLAPGQIADMVLLDANRSKTYAIRNPCGV